MHQIAADLVGAVGKVVREQQQARRADAIAGDDDDIRRLPALARRSIDRDTLRRSRARTCRARSARRAHGCAARRRHAALSARRIARTCSSSRSGSRRRNRRSRCSPAGRHSPPRRRLPASATSASPAGRSPAPTGGRPGAAAAAGSGSPAAAASPSRRPARWCRRCGRSRRRTAPGPRRRSASPAPARVQCPCGSPKDGSAARARCRCWSNRPPHSTSGCSTSRSRPGSQRWRRALLLFGFQRNLPLPFPVGGEMRVVLRRRPTALLETDDLQSGAGRARGWSALRSRRSR